MLNIVLHEPEIPQNTGNIARTCAACGARLHLIRPLGFSISDKQVQRAGLDYWDKLDLVVHDCYKDFLEAENPKELWFATTKGKQKYTDVRYSTEAYIMFGKESAGIPEEILMYDKAHCIRIPMGNDIRSLNLSNSVAIVAYEALRQLDFPGLLFEGELHHSQYL